MTTADEGAAATVAVTAVDPWPEGAKIAACSDTTALEDAITLSMSFMAVATCLLWFISPGIKKKRLILTFVELRGLEQRSSSILGQGSYER